MHDIGKVGIPDSILLKPGKLDPREWEAMKAHTTIGAQILSHSEVPMINLAEEVAFSHHEKWDGSGYPQGLKGEAIPLVGRITAVADVFDALTSRRPYKEPYTVVESLEIVRAARGYHFDPRVVDAFMASQDDVKAIRHRFGDMSDTQLFRQVRPSA